MTCKILFMDAGQGDATLIIRPDGKFIMVDCGAKLNHTIVSVTLDGTLEMYGVYKTGLLALILTHPDDDHYNLVTQLLIDKNVRIDHVYYGGDKSHYTVNQVDKWLANPFNNATVHDLGDDHFDPSPNKNLSSTDLDVRIVAANLGGRNQKTKKNLNSIVVFVTYDTTTVMLMGDAFKETENSIITYDGINGQPLKTLLGKGHSVLKVGHHGSDTSTSDEWLNWARPRAAFISSDTQLYGANGTSTCVDTVIDRLLNLQDEHKQDVLAHNCPQHNYIRYNKTSKKHEIMPTTRWLFTTLDKIVFYNPPLTDNQGRELFKADGGSWCYTMEKNGNRSVSKPEGVEAKSMDYDDK